ncbi:MAG: hydroxyisourate hydrolase [Chloroflexi bacterium]|nr:hydroxyisourate hydrolase [Chloroflexota bacterium]
MSAPTPSISTHVLDNERGVPAVGVRVTLERLDGDTFVTLTDLLTDADGRIGNLLAPFDLQPATYQISWDAGSYFRGKSGDAPFVRIVSVAFQITDTRRHYHIPLLMTRFSGTTYRGS